MRCFSAIPISETTRDEIARVIQALREAVSGKVSWVVPANLHITLHFFGEISEAMVTRLQDIFQDTLTGFSPFFIQYSGLGAFPDLKHPRVLWIGVSSGASEIVEIKKSLDRSLRKSGITFDEKEYHPHITIARFHRAHILLKNPISPISTKDTVEEVNLMESRLKPTGAEYSVVKAFPLGISESIERKLPQGGG